MIKQIFVGYGFSGDLRLLREAIPIWGSRNISNLIDLSSVQSSVCQAKEIVYNTVDKGWLQLKQLLV